MAVELQMLVWAALLAVAQLVLFAVPTAFTVGLGYVFGPRDTPRQPSGIPGRLERAYSNHLETLPLFAIAVVAVVLAGKTSPTTALAAQAYVIARVLYVPAYASGISVLRSVIWTVATAAIIIILVAALG